ncbi:Sulfotransferase family [Pannonibacter phragmitetus]|uniref:Sulfotransferase family n=1 Tax=Pannonibacter phragmitetus TaxID=121719 RepID=A0A379HJZ8_9HYPH|nr:sulfotransferase family 2 domain-containing protein [Pannonibacter phragmitetus]SUC82751.1 Sulfotransferase family [Pannonibacter phragmitetus]
MKTMQDDHLIFFHIMKTGGTSFYRFLENGYAESDQIPVEMVEIYRGIDDFSAQSPRRTRRLENEYLKLLAEVGKHRLISKLHASFNFVDDFLYFYPDTKIITILRDPVDRALSHIENLRRTPEVNFNKLDSDMRSLIEELRTAPLKRVQNLGADRFCRKIMSNYQARTLAGHVFHDLEDEVLLELALKSLERINFVGLTDRLEKFAGIVSFNLGFYNSYSQERLNVMPKESKIDPEERARIREILTEKNKVDAIVFEEAKKRFDRHVQDYHDALFQLRGGQKLRVLAPGEEAAFGMESALVGEGWLERETGLGGGCARWGGPGTSSVLYPAIALQGETSIDFNIVSVINDEIYASMQIFINDSYVPHETSIRDGFLVASVKTRSRQENTSGTRIEFRFSGVKSAFEAHGVPDHRRKTIALQSVQMRRIS